MQNQCVKIQRSSHKMWEDDKGVQIPYNRITPYERKAEKFSAKLFKDAVRINKDLQAFKDYIKKTCQNLHDTYMKANGIDKKGKGNFTWYNFDRSIKIEVSINERIEFDSLSITACKEKLDEFLSNNLESNDQFIKQLVLDAFETSKGNLDAKKVMSLLRYRTKIKAKLFQEAMELLESGIRHPDSKTYFRIWAKDADGKYENIDLNFSSI